ncbi:MAG: hypothetical protein GYA24_03845 [Candidatus Lokiarchaeota archaeon]|nr:hypothetical protein [Candidatus Lokiarchaeota archaeon]
MQVGTPEFARFYRKKLDFFKWYTFTDFCFGSITLFNVYWFNVNGLSIADIFLLGLIGMAVAMVFQNIMSVVSDKLNRRFPLLVAALVTQGISLLFSAWFPSFTGFVLYIIIWFTLSGESQRTLVQYALIKLAREVPHTSNEDDLSSQFSRYRVFGSMGTAASLPLWGWFIESVNEFFGQPRVNGHVGYQVQLTISAIAFFLLALVLVAGMTDFWRHEHAYLQLVDGMDSSTIHKSRTIDLLKNGAFLSILVPQMIFMTGFSIGSGVLDVFFKGLGASLVFLAITRAIGAVAELPLFFASAAMERRAGVSSSLMLSYAFFAAKLAIYFWFMDDALLWLAIVLESLSSFGIRWPAVTSALQRITTAHKSLALTILLTVENVFTLIGSMLGFFISTTSGGTDLAFKSLFLVALLLTGASTAMVLLFTMRKHRERA